MSGLTRALARSMTRDNASSANGLIRNLGGGGGGGGPNEQELQFDPDYVWPWSGSGSLDASNTIHTAGVTDTNKYNGWCCLSSQGRDSADGGKYMFEMTVSGVNRTNDFACIGLVKEEEAESTISFNYAGDDYGCSSLFTITAGSLCRIYVGAADSTWQTGLPDTHIDPSGTSVITCAIDFDADTVIFFIDGVELDPETFVPQDGKQLLVKSKPYGSVVTAINPTILYPVDGYTKWA